MLTVHYKDPCCPIQPKYPHTIACNGGNIYPDNYSTDPEDVTCLRCFKYMDRHFQENPFLKEFFATKTVPIMGQQKGTLIHVE